jgi:hypothetical protein
LLPSPPPVPAKPEGHEVGANFGGVAYPPVGAPGGGTRSFGAQYSVTSPPTNLASTLNLRHKNAFVLVLLVPPSPWGRAIHARRPECGHRRMARMNFSYCSAHYKTAGRSDN